jgi:hypothetical protein
MISLLDKKKNITIRLSAEVLEYYKHQAEEMGSAVSTLVADSCASWMDAEKGKELQQEATGLEEIKLRESTKVDERVHLTDPYKYRPLTFLKID